MSKDGIIQEGGRGKTITADKLRTSVVGGGDCLWVPEDEVQLSEKTINENGVYMAADDGYYGYSQVTVNGIGAATGRGADGNDYTVHTDGDGNLVEEKIPSRIEVVTPPTRTTYGDGETIDFSGIVVKQYDANGNDMGDIPFSELVFPVTMADIGEQSDGTGSIDGVEFEYRRGDRQKELRSNEIHIVRTVPPDVFVVGGGYLMSEVSGATVNYGYNSKYYISLRQFQVISYNEVTGEVWATHTVPSEPKSVDGNVFYSSQAVYYPTTSPFHAHTTVDEFDAARVLLFGQGHKEGGGQTIPVEWYRPGDYRTLESSFTITFSST